MDFKTAARIGAYISKDYAEDFFKLLVSYQDISASEAASRLGLHIRTAQDFLEGLADLGILGKEEVHEKKRPYFRYSLMDKKISLDVDLSGFVKDRDPGSGTRLIREKANAGVNFSLARGGEYISHVSLWTGEGRDRNERKISLTQPQGRFLFHLPFPNAEFLSVSEIMRKAGVESQFSPEILDIVDLLEKYNVVEGTTIDD
jgi:hypothetical protein